jgi:hypothetical protein
MRRLLSVLFLLASAAWAYPSNAINEDVTQATIDQTICVPGYTKTVRPATVYTNGVKKKLLRERGLDETHMSEYELDHIIPLALGGHPRKLENLMLQAWEGHDGAKKKDRLEVKLKKLVCSGAVPLNEARGAIYDDWAAAYRKYVGEL